MDDEIEYGTPSEMLLRLGDPACPWSLEERYIAAGHILTDWQENPTMSGMYEKMRHAYGVEDERTVHDLSADDVFEVAEQVWTAVADGRINDPRVLLSDSVELAHDRTDLFNSIADGMPARLIDGGFVITAVEGAPSALPDLWVLAAGTCSNAADYLANIHPEDAQTLREAEAVFLRLFDFTLDLIAENDDSE